ncbi:hypothetical protein [Cerasicoccus arenae]|uniref:Uncharacterized protein n=1 Tax=Cerasicoccus arenae TaxID=424488 RepID=A0A8J3D8T4_9BACT|nr:hypothetical protein [Cerasicoccus arenae]MBK1859631.1 hypothetical protein [Cerasicoccus arenae]GHB96375.1 hypothetical protein GCM10007047_10240 [Cerasicoccus arenae]
MHPRIPSLFILVSLLLGPAFSQLSAQTQDPVTVKNVKFYSKEGAYKDYLCEIELEGQVNPNPEATNPKYVDDVKVSLLMGYPHPNKSGEFIFHISEVVIATMEVKKSRKIGFWLPYDIAQRDNVGKEPEFWYIDIEVDNSQIPISQANVRNRASSNLRNPTAIQSMQNQASNASEGILLPGYLSGNGYRERGENRPPFIRKEEN